MTNKLILNETNFPDENFRKALTEILKVNENDEISDKKIAATTLLSVTDREIADLTGIEHFTALKTLLCTFNRLVSLDVSKNTLLISLYCENNQLTELDVSNNNVLVHLYCYGNRLTSLDVSKNTALKYLYCYGNRLTSLDVSNNNALEELWCPNNQLTALDVSKNTALTWLWCPNNQLTELDVTENQQLRGVCVDDNVEVYSSPNLQKELNINRISYGNILE